MNKRTYSLVFSTRWNMFVPVADMQSAHSKKSSASGTGTAPISGGLSQSTGCTWRLRPLVAALLATVGPLCTHGMAVAQALPQGGQVVQGTSTISQTGNALTVQQQTQLLGVNWQSFNIGAGQTVEFVQPNAQAVAVNRVLGNNRSEIFGNLKANGQVFLLNPNGVIFGASAQVDVGSLVASTARQASQDASGQWTLSDKGTGQVINQGHIKAENGGFVVLDSAAQTSNRGKIENKFGGVALTVAQNTRLALDGQGYLNVNVDGAVLQALVTNQGVILAEGGAVHLTARGKNMLLTNVVNQSGIIQANSVQNKNGRIFLSGGGSGMVQVSGSMEARGAQSGQSGGRIEVTGEHAQLNQATLDASGYSAGGRVRIDTAAAGSTGIEASTITANALAPSNGSEQAQAQAGHITVGGGQISIKQSTLSASGPAGGGRIEVGGGYQGQAIEGLNTAQNTAIDAASTLDVSSTGAGKGGTAIVWSDHETRFAGQIDAQAKNGDIGGDGGFGEVSGKQRLIYEGKANMLAANSSKRTGDLLLDPYNLTISSGSDAGMSGFDASADDSVLNVSTLTNALSTANVTVSTGSSGTQAGDITVANDVAWAANTTLTLTAAGKINMGANINNASTGSSAGLVLNSNGVGASGGVAGAGNIAVKSLTVHVADSAASGTLSGIISDPSGTAATLTKRGAGTLTLTGNNTYSGGTVVSAGTLDARNSATALGAITGGVTLGDANSGSSDIRLITGLTNTRTASLTASGNGTGTKTWQAVGNSITWTGGIVINGDLTFQRDAGVSSNDQSMWTGSGNVTLLGGGGLLPNVSGNKSGYSGTITVANGATVDFRGSANGRQIINNGTILVVFAENYTSLSGTGQFTTTWAYGSGIRQLTVNGSNASTFSGVITQDTVHKLALTKSGTGTLTLTGANTYTGDTLVDGGTLQVGNGGATGSLASSANIVANGTGTLLVDRSNAVSLSTLLGGNISGTGNVTVRSNAGVTVDRNIQLTGSASAITLQAGNATAAGVSTGGDVSIGASNTVSTSASGTITVFSGNANTTALDAKLSGASGGKFKSYNTATASTSGATAGARNLYYRQSPSTGLSLSNVAVVAKTYDGTTNASLSGGSITGSFDNLTVNLPTTGQFNSKDVATATTVTFAAPTASSSDGYTVLSGMSVGGQTTANASISAKTLSVSGITANNKTYDGNTSATVVTNNAGFSGMVSGDNLTVTSASGAFADKNAAAGKTVSITGITLGGTDAGNYALSSTTASTTADISAKTLSVSGITANNKTYDGNTSATVVTNNAGFSGMVSGDNLTVTSASGAFADKNAAAGKTVSITAITLGGTDAGNYALSSTTASTTADISAKTLSVSGITANNKTYDGNTSATLVTSGAGFSGMVSGDNLTVTSASGSFADKNAATGKTVSITGITLGGTDAGNYALSSTTASTTADISAKALSVSGIKVADKPADGTTTAGAVTLGAISGLVGNETVTATGSPAALPSAAPGAYSTTVSYTLADGDNGGLAANYHLAPSSAIPANILSVTTGNGGSMGEPSPQTLQPAVQTAFVNSAVQSPPPVFDGVVPVPNTNRTVLPASPVTIVVSAPASRTGTSGSDLVLNSDLDSHIAWDLRKKPSP